MKSYLITVPVKRAKGFQQFEVMANSPKDALKKFKAGKAKCIQQKFEGLTGNPTAQESPY